YAWEHGYAPWETPVAVAPDWLLELVREPDPTPPSPTPAPVPSTSHTTTSAGETIFDLLKAGWDWRTELLGRGWTEQRTHGDDTYWTRPGKSPRDGHSAVLHGTQGPLVIFTAEIPAEWT